jgi:hypothetical protein
METTLHQQLKSLYAPDAADREVRVDGYRIDAVAGTRLIEVQSAPLGAIRDKVRALLDRHDVLVVKPLAARKSLIRYARRGGRVESVRRSPRRESVYDVFTELVNFISVFPHPRLTIDVLLTSQEEHRVPAAKRRRRSKGYRVQDRRLIELLETRALRTADDLLALIPDSLPCGFSTADLAGACRQPRWLAQKMAYCLRRIDAIELIGKTGNSCLYRRVQGRRAA